MNTPNVRIRRRKERKIWRTALLASLLLHFLALLGGGRRVPPTPSVAAAGPSAAHTRAASGGLRTMNIAVPPSRPIVPPPLPVATEIEIDPVEFDSEPFDLTTLLGDRPGDAPPGLDGVGDGDGGDASEGVGGVIAVRPRGLIPPPDHDDLKGTEITIWVFVNERGRVVGDSTWLEPPTRNRKLNRQIISEAAQWLFYPATRRGEPIAVWFSYTVSMGGTGRAPSPNR